MLGVQNAGQKPLDAASERRVSVGRNFDKLERAEGNTIDVKIEAVFVRVSDTDSQNTASSYNRSVATTNDKYQIQTLSGPRRLLNH